MEVLLLLSGEAIRIHEGDKMPQKNNARLYLDGTGGIGLGLALDGDGGDGLGSDAVASTGSSSYKNKFN
jgi:hypothetical protein